MSDNFLVTSFKVNLGNTPQRKDFENLRHLSQEEASKVLGVSLSTFKRKLREFKPRIRWSTKSERTEWKKKAAQGQLPDASKTSSPSLSQKRSSSSANSPVVTNSNTPTSASDNSLNVTSNRKQGAAISNGTDLKNQQQQGGSVTSGGMSLEEQNAALLDTMKQQMQNQKSTNQEALFHQRLQQQASEMQNQILLQQEMHQNRSSLASDNVSPPLPTANNPSFPGAAGNNSENTSPPNHMQQQLFSNQLAALMPPQYQQEVHSLKSSNFALQQMLSNLSGDNQRLAGLLNESEKIIRQLMNMKMQTPIPAIPRYLGDMSPLVGPWSSVTQENKCAMFISDENAYIIATNQKFHDTLKYTRHDTMNGMKIPRMLVKNVHDEDFYISTIKRLYYSGIGLIRGNHTYKGKDGSYNTFDHVVHIETDQRTNSKYAWHELYLLHKNDAGHNGQMKAISFSPHILVDSAKGKRPALQKVEPLSDSDYGIEEHFVYSSVNQLVDHMERKRETKRLSELGVHPQQFYGNSSNMSVVLEDLSGKNSLVNSEITTALPNTSTSTTSTSTARADMSQHTTPTMSPQQSDIQSQMQHDTADHTNNPKKRKHHEMQNGYKNSRVSSPLNIKINPLSTPRNDTLFSNEDSGLSPYFGATGEVSTPRSPFSFDLTSLDHPMMSNRTEDNDQSEPASKRRKHDDDFEM